VKVESKRFPEISEYSNSNALFSVSSVPSSVNFATEHESTPDVTERTSFSLNAGGSLTFSAQKFKTPPEICSTQEISDLETASKPSISLIPIAYQNGAVLVSVGNPNFTQNGAVLIFAFIFFFFFFQEGILVTYNLQNDVVLIFFIHFDGNN
jgi:hypothetical protein